MSTSRVLIPSPGTMQSRADAWKLRRATPGYSQVCCRWSPREVELSYLRPETANRHLGESRLSRRLDVRGSRSQAYSAASCAWRRRAEPATPAATCALGSAPVCCELIP